MVVSLPGIGTRFVGRDDDDDDDDDDNDDDRHGGRKYDALTFENPGCDGIFGNDANLRGHSAHSSLYPTVQRCAMICTSTLGCWAYTWDKSSHECGLLDGLTSEVTTETPPSSSLITYYASTVNGKTMKMTTGVGYWQWARAECETMGGRLYLPDDTTHMLLLHHVLNASYIWIGMYHNPGDDLVTWYDMDGNPTQTRMLWASGQPNNNGGHQDYVFSDYGYLYDLGDEQDYNALCAM
ncbi:uncharacterized protein [Macrobrachium rosenbergii]|uniref:uncharacterized protein n=1 Tax=Macrobrachium rosenbergii TaxID=79674 RepID=UPI0034D6C269